MLHCKLQYCNIAVILLQSSVPQKCYNPQPTQIYDLYSRLSSLNYNQKQTLLTVESWSRSANSTQKLLRFEKSECI